MDDSEWSKHFLTEGTKPTSAFRRAFRRSCQGLASRSAGTAAQIVEALQPDARTRLERWERIWGRGPLAPRERLLIVAALAGDPNTQPLPPELLTHSCAPPNPQLD